jgi:hypothetical protein
VSTVTLTVVVLIMLKRTSLVVNGASVHAQLIFDSPETSYIDVIQDLAMVLVSMVMLVHAELEYFFAAT